MLAYNDRAKEKLQQWFQKAPDWQKDLFVAFWNGAEFSQEIIERAIKLVEQEYLGATHRIIAKTEFPTDIDFANIQSERIMLKSISDVQGVGALAPQRPLEFGNGLTIVYGENGCGKSTYVRILKAVENPECAINVLGNVFKEKDSSSQATITFSKDDVDTSILWTRSSSEKYPLQIYDTMVAHRFVERENAVVYEPKALSVITQMAAVFENLSQYYQNSLQEVTRELPPIFPEIVGNPLLLAFQEVSTLPALKRMLTETPWNDTLAVELETIIQGLKEADVFNVQKTFIAQKRFLEKQKRDILEILLFVDGTAVEKFIERYDNFAQLQHNFEKFNNTCEGTSVLSGFASEPWRLMWQSALKYITFIESSDSEFPVSKSNRCALCQQVVNAETQARLHQFHQLICSNVSNELEKSRNEINSLQQNMMEKIIRRIDIKGIETAMQANLIAEDIAEYIIEVYRNIVSIASWLINYKLPSDKLSITINREEVAEKIQTIIDIVEQKIKTLDRVITNRDCQIERKSRLLAIQWIQSAAPQKELIIKLHHIQTKCKTNLLTTLKKDLADILITNAYISRFNEEMRALDSKQQIKVELVPTLAKRGRSYHQIVLRGCRTNNKAGEILSEGERRVVSLAAFLADLSSWGKIMPFVFDDPITSLDQKFEERVADRLVRLSIERQVIVFTHRLAFAQLLTAGVVKHRAIANQNGEKNYAQITHVELRRSPLGEPMEASDLKGISFVNTLNKLLTDDIAKIKRAREDGDYNVADVFLQSLCAKFRKTIELGVEQNLLSGVVSRFTRVVSTLKLPYLFAITSDDIKLFERMMTKYSFSEHSQPLETPIELPDLEEIEADIGCLKNWAKEFSKRCQETRDKYEGKK